MLTYPSSRPASAIHKPLRARASRLERAAALGLALAWVGCARPAQPPPVTTAQVLQPPHAADQLLVDTASCWLGGMWGDVQGESERERELSSQQRCAGVVQKVFGRADHDRYIQLRAFEPTAVAQVRMHLVALAEADAADAPHAAVLDAMLGALADAQRETMWARRAGTRIQRDIAREPERLSKDEAAALPQIEASAGFDELLRLDAGALEPEKQSLVLFVTLDRMRAAEELPVHLKPYAVAHALNAVFGVPIPDLPHDASKPLGHGAWLAYLTGAAADVGHPVTRTNYPPQIRHEDAVAGILEGIATRLRAQLAGIETGTPLAKVTLLTIRALEQSRERVGP